MLGVRTGCRNKGGVILDVMKPFFFFCITAQTLLFWLIPSTVINHAAVEWLLYAQQQTLLAASC